MSKRKNPTEAHVGYPMDVHEDKHERKLSEMHDALYSLGNKIRKPMGGHGDKLLPKDLAPGEHKHARKARKHIDRLHDVMKGVKK